MRAVRADGKLELEQELVGRRTVGVFGAPVLPAHLAEFARPVGQHGRSACIEQRRVVRVIRLVVASARRTSGARTDNRRTRSSPCSAAARRTARDRSRSISLRADELVVDRARQRTPPQRRVDAEQLRREPPDVDVVDDAGGIVTVRIGRAEIEVRRFRDVVIRRAGGRRSSGRRACST